jgi:acetyl esterase/lipase
MKIIFMKKLLLAFLLFDLISFAKAQSVILLWPNGAPGSEARKSEVETAKDWWVKNIHNPSINIYKPVQPNGTAVVIFPGGGFRELVYNPEGKEPAEFLNKLGITAIAVKYRLSGEENSPYKLDEHVMAVGKRAMRLVRSMAKELGVTKIGIMGFSAGGVLADMVQYGTEKQIDNYKKDAIDNLSEKPDFQILIYPGPGNIPNEIPANTAPAFMLVSNLDPCCSQPVVD